MEHGDRLDRQLVKRRGGLHRLPRGIHIGHRLQREDFLAGDRALGDEAFEPVPPGRKPMRAAITSNAMKPILCRFRAMPGSGLPSPTQSNIATHCRSLGVPGRPAIETTCTAPQAASLAPGPCRPPMAETSPAMTGLSSVFAAQSRRSGDREPMPEQPGHDAAGLDHFFAAAFAGALAAAFAGAAAAAAGEAAASSIFVGGTTVATTKSRAIAARVFSVPRRSCQRTLSLKSSGPRSAVNWSGNAPAHSRPPPHAAPRSTPRPASGLG